MSKDHEDTNTTVTEIQDSTLLTPKSLTSFLKFKYFPKRLFPNIYNLPIFLKLEKKAFLVHRNDLRDMGITSRNTEIQLPCTKEERRDVA